jgi:electron transfer flavoprotein alpha subunit
MSVLIVAEHNHSQLKPSTHHTVEAGRQLSTQITVLVVGHNCHAVAEQAARIVGVSEVWVVDDAALQYLLAEPLAAMVAELAKDFAYILAPATSFGKNFLPRAAALLDLEQISEVCAIMDGQTFKRPMYAGNALATVRSSATMKIMTIRTTCFAKAMEAQAGVNIQTMAMSQAWSKTQFVSFEPSPCERPDLASAQVVVAGGRGCKSAENFKIIERLADKLGAAVGATRAAVDAGYAPNDCQIGQTGKIIAPTLYIAVGISGAIQHIAGIRDSKVVVAINKDPDAPIFTLADYGLVGDLFELIPELEQALLERQD